MDYKNRIPGYRPPRPTRKKSQAKLWIALALAGGLAIGAVGWVSKHAGDAAALLQGPSAQPNPAPAPPAPNAQTKPATAAAKPIVANPTVQDPAKPVPELARAKPEPRFTFYKILPEKEVIISENEIKNLKREESLTKKPPAAQYQLQAGSFTNAQDAEKLKARLSALKVKSHIETVKIENAAWNRVKIGPFKTLADADRVRVYLRSQQLDSVMQKNVAAAPKASKREPLQR